MIALIESDQSLRLANLTPWEEEAVDKAFSAFDPRARFVEGEWDGVTRRFDRVNKRLARPFLAGLRKMCVEHNFALAVRDQRPPAAYVPVPVETINSDWLPGITLKDFQVAAIRKACKCEVGLFAVAVSGGKCVTGETKIIVNGLEMPISSLFIDLAEEEIADVGRWGLYVHGPCGPVRIDRLYKTNRRRILKVELETGHVIRGVPEHRVYTERGWCQIGRLNRSDRIQIYPRGGPRGGPRGVYCKKSETAIWETTRANYAGTLCEFFVCLLREEVRAATAGFSEESREIQKAAVPEMCCIRSRQIKDQTTQKDIRQDLVDRRVAGTDEKEQSNTRGWCTRTANSDVPKKVRQTMRPQSAAGPGSCRRETKGSKATQRDNGLVAGRFGKISQDDGQQIEGGNRSNKSCQTGHMEGESCYARVVERTVYAGASCADQECEYSIWAADLPEPVRTALDRVMRAIEERSLAGAWPNNQDGQFMVYVRFPSEWEDDNRGQVEILVRTKDGVDLTEEVSGREVRRLAFDAIPLSNLHQVERDGICLTGNWAAVDRIADDGYENCYDLQVAHPSHAYWTNGVLSHNTELMAGICKAIRCPTVIIAEQVVVVRQIQQRLKLRLLSEEPGLFYAGKTPSGQLVIIGSIQSLLIPQAPKKPIRETFPLGEDGDLKFEKAKVRHAKSMQGYKSRRKRAKALRKLVAKCDMLLVDECDLATSNMYKMLFRYWFKGRRRFGFTGTPYDDDKPVQGLILQEHLGSVIFRQSRLDVERAGLSIPIDYYAVVFGRSNSKFDGRAFDIAINEDIVYNEEFHRLIERICHKYRDEGTLILVQRDDLGKALAERIPNSAFVHGATPQSKREQYLRAFEKREIKVLIGGKNVRRGLDLRGGCETQIIATGGKSTSDLEQQLGRSRRLNERGRSRVFDFFFYTNKYLYSHSRKRLKAVDAMGFRTFVVFPQGVIDGKAFVKSRFRTPNWRKLKR